MEVAGDGRKTILVVHDEENVRRSLNLVLTKREYRVIEASDSKEAIELAREHHPNLRTLDTMMPQIDGFDATAVLKNDPDTRDIPILILSTAENNFWTTVRSADMEDLNPQAQLWCSTVWQSSRIHLTTFTNFAPIASASPKSRMDQMPLGVATSKGIRPELEEELPEGHFWGVMIVNTVLGSAEACLDEKFTRKLGYPVSPTHRIEKYLFRLLPLNTLLFLGAWLTVTFSAGTSTLLGPVPWLTKYFREQSWPETAEDLGRVCKL